DRLAAPDEDREDPEQEDLGEEIFDPEACEEALLALDHHVDGHADEDLRRDVEELVDDGINGAAHVPAAEFAAVREEATQRRHRLLPTARRDGVPSDTWPPRRGPPRSVARSGELR